MSGIFHFRGRTPCFPRPAAALILFAGPTAYDRNSVIDAITEETRRAVSPEAAYLIYSETMVERARLDLVDNMDVFSPLADDSTIGIYQYDGSGKVSLVTALRGTPINDLPLDQIRRQGLTTLFRRSGGVLEAGATAHFVRPSRRPSSRFLRASHALSDGAEIYFAAFWLLPYLADDIENVHLDTSGIASVVLAALILRKGTSHPTIRTFHSYDGLAAHPFSVDRPDLVLISASQSGTMAQDIIPRVADSSRIITLFSSADPPPGTRLVCDIRHDDDDNSEGYLPAAPVPDVPTTRPIRLISEHFLVEPEPPRAIVPVRDDRPPVVLSTLSRLVGKNVLVSLRRTDIGDVRHSLWIDMAALKRTDCFNEWVQRMVNNFIPAATRALVQLTDDAQSAVVADAVLTAVQAQGGDLVEIQRLTLANLEAGSANWKDPGSPIVVTGATAGRGTQLLAASRALRRFAPKSHRIYLAPGTIAISERSLDLLARNLQQPGFRFETMFRLIIDRERAAESWRDERLLLDNLRQNGDPEAVEVRSSSLSGVPEGRVNGLFLDSPLGPLQLRDNFAFWPATVECTAASQADVFTTICAILENLRSPAVKLERRLINDVQSHSVLDAETFSRYNDGVIQAAFLRAALPVELNYQDTPANSRLMLDLLRQMIGYADRQQGEALAEFLLAIACGRLRMVDLDFVTLQGLLAAGVPGATEMGIWLANCIVDRSVKLRSWQ